MVVAHEQSLDVVQPSECALAWAVRGTFSEDLVRSAETTSWGRVLRKCSDPPASASMVRMGRPFASVRGLCKGPARWPFACELCGGSPRPVPRTWSTGRQQLRRRLVLSLLRLPLCASRLRGAHRRNSILVDLNDVASRVWAAREALETFRSPENDRVGVAAGLDHVALFDLLVEERVEAVPTSP
jgi:hypothetical protein